MELSIASTPFGSRPMSLALLATQRVSHTNIPAGKAVDKWQVYRNLCEAKTIVGVSDRSLAVLAALLSFYPDSELSKENGLVVFPSNRQLSLRAHGMADTTLRRHLAALVECGLIHRRDSPNGKRYAKKGGGGEIKEAFGLSLSPLLARADDFRKIAEQMRADRIALRLMRERVTLFRRDISKLIEVAFEERLAGDWNGLLKRFRIVVEAIPRRATLANLETIGEELAEIHDTIGKLLSSHMNIENVDGNESHIGRQQSNSHTDSNFEYEPAAEKGNPKFQPIFHAAQAPNRYPLGLVLRACPDITDYALAGIGKWRDLITAAHQVSRYLGISPSAYADALDALGQENTAIVIACILQRETHIKSAGGYLRTLTEKAREGVFSVGPMLMAALKLNGRAAIEKPIVPASAISKNVMPSPELLVGRRQGSRVSCETDDRQHACLRLRRGS